MGDLVVASEAPFIDLAPPYASCLRLTFCRRHLCFCSTWASEHLVLFVDLLLGVR